MKISQNKKEKISEQILLFLYTSFPKQPFTAEIAREIARDEEFVKLLLLDLQHKSLVTAIHKNKQGMNFTRRIRWRLPSNIYEIYNSKSNNL
jgi:predicted transcriptional regulator with HTH domain